MNIHTGGTMKSTFSIMLGTATFLSALVLAGDSAAQKKQRAATLWPAEDITWTEMKNAPPGIMHAPLWGDPAGGAHGMLVTLPAGFTTPLHVHSHDLKIVIISGTMLHTEEGADEQMFGPGSYLDIPGGNRHITGVTADSPCMLFQESPGKFDLKPVTDHPTK
jgi:quercetin dioxygenase-like cupin family protein